MCAVSMVSDHYQDKWRPQMPQQYPPFVPIQTLPNQDVSKDIAKLREEFEEMKQLLKRAIKYDEDNNQPHCENEDKIKFLKQVADTLGLTLEDVFPTKVE